MKKIIFLIAVIMNIGIYAQAQFPVELENIFQEILNEISSDTEALGISVAVLSEDDLWASATGLHASDSMLTTSSTFGIGSVSKTITAATILQMMEDGLLTLDDPISIYLDTMTNIPPEATIRQLLNHTSGIFNYTENPDFFDYSFANLSEFITEEFVLENFLYPPLFTPGTQWSYSNTNYILLGLIIEEISGNEYYVEARNRFNFDINYPSLSLPPYESDVLDMAHIFADSSEIIGSNPAVDIVDVLGLVVTSPFSGAGAAGAYAANPSDMARWAYDLYGGNVLEAATMDSMLTISSPSTNYGLGVIVAELPCGPSFQGHSGRLFYTSSTYYDPEKNIAISIHCNDADLIITDDIFIEMMCAYEDFLITTSTVEEVLNESIEVFPNPFSNNFSIKYEIKNSQKVQMKLFNELGLMVDQWFLGEKTIGKHSMHLETTVPNGIYFLKIQMGNDIITKRIVKM